MIGDALAALDDAIEQRRDRARQYLPGSHTFPAASAAGSLVLDDHGRPYLDFGVGGQVNLLGHCHPEITRTIWAHSHQLYYSGSDHLSAAAVRYAELLASKFPQPRQVLVLPSLTEAWEVVQTITDIRVDLRGCGPHARVGGFLIADETLTGLGRTGTLWGQDCPDPDIVVLGPSGGGGLPFAAVVAPPELFSSNLRVLPPLACHPLVSAVATVVLEHITDPLLEHVVDMEQALIAGIIGVAQQFPTIIVGTDGVGLRQKLSIHDQGRTAEFHAACRSNGLLLHPDLTMTPPLVITEQEVRHAVDIIAGVCLDWE